MPWRRRRFGGCCRQDTRRSHRLGELPAFEQRQEKRNRHRMCLMPQECCCAETILIFFQFIACKAVRNYMPGRPAFLDY